MKTLAYDVETFVNFFCLTAINVEDRTDKYVFYVGLGKTDYTDIQTFLKNDLMLIGYNNHSYDDPILRYIQGYAGISLNADLFKLSGKLIDENERNDKQIMSLRYPRDVHYSWQSIDLMKMMAFDRSKTSLKQIGINLKCEKVQDLPVAYDAYIQEQQLDLILSYNANDVEITLRLYEETKPLRELREQLKILYEMDFSSASKAKIGAMIFEKLYTKETGIPIKALRDLRTPRYKIMLGDCIAKFVEFKSPELKELYDRVSSTYVYNYNKYKYNETIYFANCAFSLGVGGIHTEDEPGIFLTDEKYIIRDADVSSYYPNLIINNNFYPAHLGPNFIKVLNKITVERISAKKAKDKIKAESLKISINSVFGKLGFEYYWLYDPKQLISTTITGQLGLLMLVEDMYMNGIEVISCNTDGVVCRIPCGLEDKYYEIAKAWQAKTGLELEFTNYKKYVRRDVNSYITIKDNGDTKEKGAFLTEAELDKAYHMPIVAKALHAYFVKGIPVEETINNCKDIMEFCISQKSASSFVIELHTINGIKTLQKTNRFFITCHGGSLIKRDFYSKKMTGLYVGRLVHILNEYDESIPFEEYDVDLQFYKKEVMKIIDKIEPKQISMFDSSTLARSSITKMATSSISSEPAEKEFSVFDLNKLGKNQFAKKIESIANSDQKILKISPRYVYIMDFDIKSMVATIYCLNKALRQEIKIEKTAYKKEKIEKGMLIYCNKFSKKNGESYISEYRITEKIEEEEVPTLEEWKQ